MAQDKPQRIDLANFQDSKESFNQNLDYQLLEEQKTLSEYNLKNYKYSQLPTLGAFFNHQYNAYRNEFNFFADKPWFPQTGFLPHQMVCLWHTWPSS